MASCAYWTKALRLLETLLGALDEQEVLFAGDGDGTEVKIVLCPEIGVERRAIAGMRPKFFGIGKKDFEKWEGVETTGPAGSQAGAGFGKPERPVGSRARKPHSREPREHSFEQLPCQGEEHFFDARHRSLALVSKVGQPCSETAAAVISHRSRRSALFKTKTKGSGPS